MSYEPLGLGALIVQALRTAVADPKLQEQADAATAAFESLNERIETLINEVNANANLDTEQAATLDGIQTELRELATALTPVMVEVEVPTEAPVEQPAPDGSAS